MFRIVIADPDELRTIELAGTLARMSGLDVVGTAHDAVGALDLMRRMRPDVVFVDIALPPLGGLAIVRSIKRAVPGAQVVVITAALGDDALLRAAMAGADGVLTTDGPAEHPVHLHWLHPDEDPDVNKSCLTRRPYTSAMPAHVHDVYALPSTTRGRV